MSRVLLAFVLGAGVGTILWFTLSPFLTDQQEEMVGWLLTGSYVVVMSVWLPSARRQADQDNS